ncbi:hypothetical protein PhCBS80983_g02943 [Powellomyces hirtus]|uniref:Uncharacterized protein n=1 Tax=Powellomyces hirtus TaxID=109895 RepID=A0A507E4D0_9FUNG|nr:hypothetical protein PhCBS80983_g02943 [Powellomyces hirtus]
MKTKHLPPRPSGWSAQWFLSSVLLLLGISLSKDILDGTNFQLSANNLRLLNRPEQFHGENVTGPFFEGWYYKTVLPKAAGSVIFIPGVFVPKSMNGEETTDTRQQPHGFVMVIRDPHTVECLYYAYPMSEFSATPGTEDGYGFTVRIGKSTFHDKGMELNLDAAALVRTTDDDTSAFMRKALRERQVLHPELRFPGSEEKLLTREWPRKALSVRGSVTFLDSVRFPGSKLIPTVMGPFAYLPAMECYHGLVSQYHQTTGAIRFETAEGSKEHEFDVTGGEGYMEKDHGINFPMNWIWLQAGSFAREKGSSLMMSIADVPLLSKKGMLSRMVSSIPVYGSWLLSKFHMTGFLVTLHHSRTNTTHNLSLYTGSRIKSILSDAYLNADEKPMQEVEITVTDFWRTKKMMVRAKRPIGAGVPLPGPIVEANRMALIVEETLTVDVDVVFTVDGVIVLEDSGSIAGMEVVGDMKSLISGI